MSDANSRAAPTSNKRVRAKARARECQEGLDWASMTSRSRHAAAQSPLTLDSTGEGEDSAVISTSVQERFSPALVSGAVSIAASVDAPAI